MHYGIAYAVPFTAVIYTLYGGGIPIPYTADRTRDGTGDGFSALSVSLCLALASPGL